MSIDENKTFTELAIGGLASLENSQSIKTELISEYLLKQLDIDFSKLTEDEKTLLMKNFIHLMCLIIKDIKLVNSRLNRYKEEYHKYEKDKSNAAEYYRRKIEYFCTINKNALKEIFTFLQEGLKEYLVENKFDTLKREQESDSLNKFFMGRRYKVAQFPEYYDIDYDFATIVKVNYLPGVNLTQMMKVEKDYLSLRKNDEKKYIQKLHNVVDKESVIDDILMMVNHNYHLHKRYEIFQDLARLFSEKHYQSFMSLGLLQLEGLFYDLCQIKYGVKENMGTLVEKVQKSLQGKNEFSFMRFYPYFAFDIPIQRNEIAHKGMIETTDLEDSAYNLILDLNTVVKMVKSESYDKFIVFVMIHEQMIKLESEGQEKLGSRQKVYRTFLTELIENSVIANEYFWSVLKKPEDFEEEMSFYKPEELQDGYVDLSGIVTMISLMIRQKDFWQELLNVVNELKESNGDIPEELYDFAKRLKNDYISELTGEVKNYCIEISKLLK